MSQPSVRISLKPRWTCRVGVLQFLANVTKYAVKQPSWPHRRIIWTCFDWRNYMQRMKNYHQIVRNLDLRGLPCLLMQSGGRWVYNSQNGVQDHRDGGGEMRLRWASGAVTGNNNATRLCRPIIRRWHCRWGLSYSSSAMSVGEIHSAENPRILEPGSNADTSKQFIWCSLKIVGETWAPSGTRKFESPISQDGTSTLAGLTFHTWVKFVS